MQGAIGAADPASKVIYTFSEPGKLNDAIKNYGFIPTMASGQPFVTQSFEDGYLLNGAPINVHMYQVWYEGQRELLQPYWESGAIPSPVAELLSLPIVPMPEDVAQNYQVYKSTIANASGGIPTALIGFGALALIFLLSSGGSKKSAPADDGF